MSLLETVAALALIAFLIHLLRTELDAIFDGDRYYRAGFDDVMRLGVHVARHMTDDEIAEYIAMHGWDDEP